MPVPPAPISQQWTPPRTEFPPSRSARSTSTTSSPAAPPPAPPESAAAPADHGEITAQNSRGGIRVRSVDRTQWREQQGGEK